MKIAEVGLRRWAVIAIMGGGAILPLAADVQQRQTRPRRAVSGSEQASLGRSVFERSCSGCHTADVSRPATAELPTGLPIALAGRPFVQKWRTAADLFSKISMTMPIDAAAGVGGLHREEYVGLVAYLLQVNGGLRGRAVPDDLPAMKEFRVGEGSARSGQPPGVSLTAAGRGGGYYTEDQAERGRAYFNGSCSLCHVANLQGATPGDLAAGRGFLTGRGRNLSNTARTDFAERWRTVGRLFDKVRTTMPAYDYGALSDTTYVDIVAYLLKANGRPAGREELAGNIERLRAMTLVEEGFQPVFNGQDFNGLKFLIGNNCLPRPGGCGQTEPGSTFRIENGAVVCSGKPQGYMYTEQRYLDFTLRLEYRYTPIDGVDDDSFFGNSGYMLFVTDHQVWPKMVEIQGGNSSVLSVISSALPATFSVDDAARARALKPVGQWNAVEIVSKGGVVRSSLNGTLVSTVTQHQYREPGHIGFQSEGAEIRWRNLRIRPE